MLEEQDSTLQKPKRPNLFKEGVQRLRALFLPSEGLHIGDNKLVAKKDAGGNQEAYWQRRDGTEVNLSRPPGARVYNSSAQTLTSGATTALTFNSERFDTDGMHDTATNTARLTANTAGVYMISAHAQWAGSPANGLMVFRVNGTTNIAWSSGEGDYRYMSLTSVYAFAAGDYVTAQVQQNSGGDLNINSAGNYTPEFSMVWLAP